MKMPKFIEFRVANFRSINKEVIFSLQANDNIDERVGNTFDIELSGGEQIRLLKSAAIYGANASGKSNFLRGFSAFSQLLSNTWSKKSGEEIENDPFLLDRQAISNPTKYFFDFVGTNSIRYQYSFSHNNKQIFNESLEKCTRNGFVNIFKRANDIVSLGDGLSNKPLSTKIISPRLFLSHLANNEAEEICGDIYRNIQNIIVRSMPISLESQLSKTLERMSENFGKNPINDWVNRLITNADFQTLGLRVESSGTKYSAYTKHRFFAGETEDGTIELPFISTASEGTKFFIEMIGIFATMIEDGLPCLMDELNSSLHPDLCKVLIKLLHDSNVNKEMSQLIFTSHDISLIDKTFLRKDQIWFTEKNNFGGSNLYSAQDFGDIPENVSYGDLYEAGFFRARPKINERRIKYPESK